MKIRSHFILILVILTAVPIFFLSGFYVYLYATSPERFLFDNLAKMKSFDVKSLTKKDRAAITKYLRERSPNLEEAFFFSDGIVIHSTIPSIPDKGRIDAERLSARIFEKAEDYYYQISSIPIESYPSQLIHMVRYPRNVAQRGSLNNGALPRPRDFVVFFAIIFEAFFTVLSIIMLHKIAKSLNLVEKEAQKLKDGDIERPIEIPLNQGFSNEITSLLIHMEEFRKALKERKNQRDRFVLGLGHDLKTPLAVIKGYTEGISDGLFDDSKKKSEALQIILQKTSQLETMVDNMVNFIRISESDWSKTFEERDLAAYILEFEKNAKTTGEIFNRTVTVSCSVPSGIKVKMDEQLVSRALENIFSNAIRYTEPAAEIDVSACIENNRAKIMISDKGIGMTQEETKRAFELFFRGTNSRREQGQGIGLSVVKTVMDIHNWEIDVKSEKGIGTSFTITIPITS